jgi:hypothetical protein
MKLQVNTAGALLALLVTACSDDSDRYSMRPMCSQNDPARAEWILKCAEAANPMSDEEGEDLVLQCENTSERLFCPRVLHRWYALAGVWRPVEPEAPKP